MTKTSQFKKGDIILTTPEDGFYGIAVVLSEKEKTPESYPKCHIAITPLLFRKEVQLEELDLNDLKPLVFNREYNLKGKKKAFKKETCIGVYIRNNKQGFKIIGQVNPKLVYDGPLPFEPLNGLPITYPLYGETNEYLGREAYIHWANENIVDIDCQHGKGVASIVCGHLLDKNHPLGFIENSSDPNDLQGWCYDCENLFLNEGEMTDTFLKYSNATVVCEKCYAEIKAYHDIA